METILFYTTITLLGAVIVINLVLPLALAYHVRRLTTISRFSAIKSLYGQHYRRRNSLTSDKR
jgi:hypothetical protein